MVTDIIGAKVLLSPSSRTKTNTSGKLIVVSNRLPVTLKRGENGEHEFTVSSGGLIAGLMGMGKKFNWVGWLGCYIPEGEQLPIRQSLWDKGEFVPVFLNDNIADGYYNYFSNGILWPLFHYLCERESSFNHSHWEQYKEANRKFADAVLEVYQPGDTVWVHDYHLMLLPLYLREKIPECNIGFFLHIPFPSAEIYRTIPVRTELLEGLLASNLIGFHTYDYCRHFLSACMRQLGSEITPKGLIHGGMSVTCGVFPIGIDPNKWTECLCKPETQARIAELKEKFKGQKIVLGVDRLDYTKGLPLKFQAFERFLTLHPEFREKVTLIQIGVPTRETVQEYKELITEVNELCGRINSKFGTVSSFPIHYIHNSVPFVELCALYYIADVCLITAVRDGMNLVSYEYIACQRERNGVLLLSEFAGAASSLSGSVLINPYDIEGTARAIREAFDMPDEEKRIRFSKNELVVFEQNTAAAWGEHFLEELDKACDPSCYFLTKTPPLDVNYAVQRYLASGKNGNKRVFFLDYDGTLTSIQKHPHLATPSRDLLINLEKLSNDPSNLVYIVSGRDRKDLENWLGHLSALGLAAEHGMVIRHPGATEWTTLYEDLAEMDMSWMKVVEAIFRHLSSRIPGSSIEVKKTSLCFHYRNVEVHYGKKMANELKLHLAQALVNMPIDIITGKMVIEVRLVGVNKGALVRKLLIRYAPNRDFVFCVGDDRTDEDMFELLKDDEQAITCIIGKPEQHSMAKSRLGSTNECVAVLRKLADATQQQ
eukprot:GEZU01014023.1.p1 GENE.GEZU01014023.1~~GEZU01014023.1.p1  ORF type:complete len:794 (+),score=283.04 GEZU01014023.1:81-2384(+)